MPTVPSPLLFVPRHPKSQFPRVWISSGTLHSSQAVKVNTDKFIPDPSALSQRPAWSLVPWVRALRYRSPACTGNAHICLFSQMSVLRNPEDRKFSLQRGTRQPCLEETQAAPSLYQPQERSQQKKRRGNMARNKILCANRGSLQKHGDQEGHVDGWVLDQT